MIFHFHFHFDFDFDFDFKFDFDFDIFVGVDVLLVFYFFIFGPPTFRSIWGSIKSHMSVSLSVSLSTQHISETALPIWLIFSEMKDNKI